MVDSIKPTYRSVPLNNQGKKTVEAPEGSQGAGDDAHQLGTPPPLRDRRKKRDRRQNQRDSRPVYDMRSGRGRRKTDRGHPTITTKA